MGSIVNRVYSGPASFEPEVGMGATVLMWSDRHAATVVEVLRYKSGALAGKVRAIVVQEDRSTVVSGSAHDGSAVYEHTANPFSARETFYRNKAGQFALKCGNAKLAIGFRETYQDPSF